MTSNLDKRGYSLRPAEREAMWREVVRPLHLGQLPPPEGPAGRWGRWFEEFRPFLTTGAVLAAALLIVAGTLNTFLTDRGTWSQIGAARRPGDGAGVAGRRWLDAPIRTDLEIVFEGVTDDEPERAAPLVVPTPAQPTTAPTRLAIRTHDAETSETLQYTSVMLANAADSVLTPLLADGVLRGVAAGLNQKLYLTHLGYASRETTIDLHEGAAIDLDLALMPRIVGTLEIFDVEGESFPPPEPPRAPATGSTPYVLPRQLPTEPSPGLPKELPTERAQTGVHRLPSPPAPRTPALGRFVAPAADAAAPDPGFEPTGGPDAVRITHPASAGGSSASAVIQGAASPFTSGRYLLRIGVPPDGGSPAEAALDFAREQVATWRRLDHPAASSSGGGAGDSDRLTAMEGGEAWTVGLYEIELTAAAEAALEHGSLDASTPLAILRRRPGVDADQTIPIGALRPRFDTAPPRFRLACLGVRIASLTSVPSTPAADRTELRRWLALADSLSATFPATDQQLANWRAWLATKQAQVDRR